MTCMDANTGIKTQVSSKAANIAFGITVSGTGDTRKIEIETDTSGTYLFRIWLIDDNTDPGQVTPIPPSGDDTTVWHKATNSSGYLTFDVTHDGTRNWYPAAVLLGPIAVGDVLQYT